MREIKFRAWDSYQNKMYEWNEICKMDSEGHITLSNLLNNLIEHIKPIQFTGLKDENGVEIYEGNTVKNTIKKKQFIIPKKGKPYYRNQTINTVFVVKYNNHWCCFDLIKGHVRGILEVIETLHENPELLK